MGRKFRTGGDGQVAPCEISQALYFNISYKDRTINKPVTIASAKITPIGNSVGVTLPKEVLAKLHVGKGDTLCLTETPEGILLTPYNAEFANILEAAETIMRENRDALRVLAR